jgi:hypothetical protein
MNPGGLEEDEGSPRKLINKGISSKPSPDRALKTQLCRPIGPYDPILHISENPFDIITCPREVENMSNRAVEGKKAL